MKQCLHRHSLFWREPLDPRSPPPNRTRLVNRRDRPIPNGRDRPTPRSTKIMRALGVLARLASPDYVILLRRSLRMKSLPRSKMRRLPRYPDRDLLLVASHPAPELNVRLDLPPLRSLWIPLVKWQRPRHLAQILSAIPVIPRGRSASPTVRVHPLTCC